MGSRSRPRAQRGRRIRGPLSLPPGVEWLDRRTLLAALSTRPGDAAAVQLPRLGPDLARSRPHPNEFDLYSATLQAGDTLDINIVAQATGSGLASLLRVFDANGTPLALDNQQGG